MNQRQDLKLSQQSCMSDFKLNRDNHLQINKNKEMKQLWLKLLKLNRKKSNLEKRVNADPILTRSRNWIRIQKNKNKKNSIF